MLKVKANQRFTPEIIHELKSLCKGESIHDYTEGLGLTIYERKNGFVELIIWDDAEKYNATVRIRYDDNPGIEYDYVTINEYFKG